MRERGVEIPDKYIEPDVCIDTQFYLIATTQLLTCRPIGMEVGPIPWTAIYAYCKAVNFSNWERMYNIVSRVDTELRAKSRDKHQKVKR